MLSSEGKKSAQVKLSSSAYSNMRAVQIMEGIEILKKGGLVAFPTDTLYGLGADFLSSSAIQRVITTKGRDEYMGLPLLMSGLDDLRLVARDVSETAWMLASHFWPGALTLILLRSSKVSEHVTGGRDSVAVRVPDHPVPRALVQGLGRPITGTSANLSGHPVALCAEDVISQLGSEVDIVINGGCVDQNSQSTIVDATGPVLKVLRHGDVSLSSIKSVYYGDIDTPIRSN
jgi:L-threonylcarbamoyladenylate synthase